MDRKCGDIEVEHVYDLAAEIGDEFQKMIDNLGSDVVKSLMPKVIKVLEHLEMLSIRKDDVESQLDSLKLSIYELEHQKGLSAQNQCKYEYEMEIIDENWRKENLHLTECVNQLRNQNIKLTNSLIDKEKTLSQSLTDLQMKGQLEIDSEILSLKESIKRSDHKIETLTKDMDTKNDEMDKLYEQIEAVMQQNRDLRRRLKNSKTQRHLAEAETDLHLKDLIEMSKHLMSPNNDSKGQQIECIDDSMVDSKPQPFSLTELRNILFERNSLKTRVNELEEELNELKLLINNSSNKRHSIDSVVIKEEDELVVEGPINREPDDKLFPGRQQNKILRFTIKSFFSFPSLSWPRIKRP